MVRLKLWQWIILAAPIASIVIFLLVAAGMQISAWGLSWIWAVFTLVFVGWRWLLVRWTKPAVNQIEAVLAEVRQDLEAAAESNIVLPQGQETTEQIEAALQEILTTSQNDRPIWEDWQTFWQRCQDLVVAIAHVYNPTVKYPLLNIYVPQAYGLIRGTVEEVDVWMQKLSPVLNQVTVGQAYQAYEVYRKLEPKAQKFLRAWNMAQWLLNPAAAAAKKVSENSGNRATQELLINLSQLIREVALRNLCKQAIALYGGSIVIPSPTVPKVETQALRDILTQAQPPEQIEQKPVNILVAGRTGAGKSSLINTLFQSELAEVDVLPSTDTIKNYHWQTPNGEILTLWDTPGYEQVKREDLRNLVIDYAHNADLLLLVTPALDPALQMDVDFLQDIRAEVKDLPIITIVTQVDRLRPIREWESNYDWEWGDKPKEIAIREATEYRQQRLGEFSNLVLPIVTSEQKIGRVGWGIDTLSWGLMDAIEPAKQLRLARFLRNLEARTVASAKIIDRYSFQMKTTQGLTALVKSPVLQFIATLSTGSPQLAYLLAEKIPVEQLPIVIGKLQMAYELFSLFNNDNKKSPNFDLLSLWPLLLENSSNPDRNAWAFGHALVEYWTQNLSIEQLKERFNHYLQQS
ncbi:MAG TPA: GTPase family protein [Nostocaceae cyanobacterium]|nr:GTPase family protein [Nostocaceae cyanobacterium]